MDSFSSVTTAQYTEYHAKQNQTEPYIGPPLVNFEDKTTFVLLGLYDKLHESPFRVGNLNLSRVPEVVH